MDRAEYYLLNNDWDKIEDPDKRSREFRFQKDLSDSLLAWSEAYVNLSGIIDVYNQLKAVNKKSELRAGQTVSGIQSFVKNMAEKKGG